MRLSGAGDLADIGITGLLRIKQLAVRAAVAGLDRFQLRDRAGAGHREAPCSASCGRHGRRRR